MILLPGSGPGNITFFNSAEQLTWRPSLLNFLTGAGIRKPIPERHYRVNPLRNFNFLVLACRNSEKLNGKTRHVSVRPRNSVAISLLNIFEEEPVIISFKKALCSIMRRVSSSTNFFQFWISSTNIYILLSASIKKIHGI